MLFYVIISSKLFLTNKGGPHQNYCNVCEGGGELLLCDSCTKSFHLACLEPELQDLPEFEWFCPNCENQKKGKAALKTSTGSILNDGLCNYFFAVTIILRGYF